MMGTNIAWTHFGDRGGETWNPIVAYNKATGRRGQHCEKVSIGCRNCYAETLNRAQRFHGTGLPYTRDARSEVRHELHARTLDKPLHWRKPRCCFVCSMDDLFGEWVPFDWIDKVFAVMALCPQHVFQVLTKRPERMKIYTGACRGITRRDWVMSEACRIANAYKLPRDIPWPLPNVWLGASVETQSWLDKRLPHLLRCPAAVRFLSAEPLLGRLVLPIHTDNGEGMDEDERPEKSLPATVIRTFDAPPGARIDQVIVGGESGPGARRFECNWAREIHDDCRAAGAAFFFKQLGSNAHADDWLINHRGNGGNLDDIPEYLRVREFPEVATCSA